MLCRNGPDQARSVRSRGIADSIKLLPREILQNGKCRKPVLFQQAPDRISPACQRWLDGCTQDISWNIPRRRSQGVEVVLRHALFAGWLDRTCIAYRCGTLVGTEHDAERSPAGSMEFLVEGSIVALGLAAGTNGVGRWMVVIPVKTRKIRGGCWRFADDRGIGCRTARTGRPWHDRNTLER
jgi:hypothetical protein